MSDLLVVVAKPVGKPVSLAEAKTHLLITDVSYDGTYLSALLEAATLFGENYTRREFRATTFILYADTFQVRQSLPREVESVDEVAHLVSASYAAVASSVYYVKRDDWDAEVLLQDEQEWPDTTDDGVEHAIRYSFTARPCSDLALVKQAILLHVSYMYENRGDCPMETGVSSSDGAVAGNTAKACGAATLYDQLRVPRF